MKAYRKIACLLILLCFTTALAQDATCGATVQEALNEVQQGCASTARNQACYGYVALQATPRDGVQNFTFVKAGDLANVADLNSLRLTAFDSVKKTWGIALMRLQANLPDALPGQNVTFLMFGDVQIQNAVAPDAQVVTVPITAKSSANVRTAPSTAAQPAGALARGETTTASGRNQDGSWLLIQIPDSSSLGWVYASLVTPASDVSALRVVDSTQAVIPYKPMQAFYFQAGIAQANCAQAPADGILIQTPQGVGQINLLANDVSVTLGSTAFLQAQPSANLTVSIVEGEGHVTSNGKTVAVPAGAQVEIPLDANLKPAGAPGNPHPYDPALVANLPVQDLPDPITIALPASAAQILAANQPPTPTPKPQTGASGFNVAGLTGNLGALNALSGAEFCQQMTTILASTGITVPQYYNQIKQMEAGLTPGVKAQFDVFLAKLGACP